MTEMTVIEISESGGPEVLVPAKRPVPQPGSPIVNNPCVIHASSRTSLQHRLAISLDTPIVLAISQPSKKPRLRQIPKIVAPHRIELRPLCPRFSFDCINQRSRGLVEPLLQAVAGIVGLAATNRKRLQERLHREPRHIHRQHPPPIEKQQLRFLDSLNGRRIENSRIMRSSPPLRPLARAASHDQPCSSMISRRSARISGICSRRRLMDPSSPRFKTVLWCAYSPLLAG